MPMLAAVSGSNASDSEPPVSAVARKLHIALSVAGDGAATDESSSGLEDGQPACRSKGTYQGKDVVGPGSSAKTQLPSPLLPAFETSPDPTESIEISSRSPRPSTPPRNVQASPGLPRSPRMYSLSQAASPRLDTPASSQGKLAKADHRLKSIVAQLSRFDNVQKRKNSLEAEAVSSPPIGAGSPHVGRRPSASTQVAGDGQPAATVETPRRSRLARVLSPSSSPSSTPRRSPRIPASPHLDAGPTSPSPGRRWSVTLQAILSPSPTIPRTSSPSLSVTDSPRFGQENWQQWEEAALVEAVRKALSEYLLALRRLAEEEFKIAIGQRGLREAVLSAAMSICTGLAVSGSDNTDLRPPAEALLSALADLQDRTPPLPLPRSELVCTSRSALLFGLDTCSFREDTEDVFESTAITTGVSKEQVEAFVGRYESFSHAIVTCDKLARAERRRVRLARRQTRISKANMLYNLNDPPTDHLATAAIDIATFSSLELLQHALHRALREELFSQDDVETFEPRLLLTLPRLALLYGVHESSFPILPAMDDVSEIPLAMQTSLEVFLPRLCRPLPPTILRDIKQLPDASFQALARKLCSVELDDALQQEGKSARQDGDTERQADLFRSLASEADGGGRSGRHIKMMRKVLRIHLSETGQDSEAEDEVLIAKVTTLHDVDDLLLPSLGKQEALYRE